MENIQEMFKEIIILFNNFWIDIQKINLINVFFQGFKIVQGFVGIISKVFEVNVVLLGDFEVNVKLLFFGDDDVKFVVKFLIIFVEVYQVLLNVVIGKYGLFILIFFFEFI